MKKIIAASIIALLASNAEAKTYSSRVYYWEIQNVVDGGNIVVDAQKDFVLPVTVTIADIESPEAAPTAKCPAEAMLAKRVAQFVMAKIQESKKNGMGVTFENIDWSKRPGGQVEADVYLGGNNLAEMLINAGLAKKVLVSGPRPNWCL